MTSRSNSLSWILKGLFVLILVNFLVVFFAYGRVMASSFFSASIMEGVKINQTDLGGLSKEKAVATLAGHGEDFAKKKATFIFGGKEILMSHEDLGAVANIDATVQRAVEFGKTGALQNRYREVTLANAGKVNLPLLIELNEEQLAKAVTELARKIDLAPKDAFFHISESGEVETKGEQYGQILDKNNLIQQLKAVQDWDQPLVINLKVDPVKPKLLSSELSKLAPTQVIASVSTNFDAGNVMRKENLVVAARQLNNKLFAPGEEISFNKVVGPRVVERGFKEANVIVRGKLVPGIGGGVCQVSSTLYNAALKANLEITRRSNHSLKVGYLPAGLDATVSGEVIDFKFKNSSPGYILIKAKVSGSKLNITIMGVPEQKKYNVNLISQVLKTIPFETITIPDNNLFVGQEEVVQKGQPGYKVKVIKELSVEGKIIKKEIISTDNYNAQQRIIKVGIKPWQ